MHAISGNSTDSSGRLIPGDTGQPPGSSPQPSQELGCNDNGECVDHLLVKNSSSKTSEESTTFAFRDCCQIICKVDGTMKPKKVHLHSARDLHQKLRQYPECKDYRDEKGCSLLVLIILEGRVDCLEPLFNCGILFEMLDVKISETSSKYKGLAPRDIISKFNLKKILSEIQELTKLEQSMTKLHKIARTGNAEAVKFLLQRHPQMMETPARDGSNCFMWAVTSGNLQVVKMIVAAGGKYKKRTNSNENALGRATNLGYLDIIEYLIKELNFDPNEKCKGDRTAFCIALDNNDANALQTFINCKAIINNDILPKAAGTGKLNLWNLICQNIKSLDIDCQDEFGRTALYIAVEIGNIDIARAIIAKNGCLTKKNPFGRSLLFAAIDSKDINMFNYIIDELKRKFWLQRLINERDIYCGKERLFTITGRDRGILIYHFVEVHRIYLDIFGKRIHEGGELDIAKYGDILSSGWGVPTAEEREGCNRRYDIFTNINRERDMSPLHYAIVNQQTEMALTLIKEGADVHIKDSFGNQPLHLAAMRGDKRVIQELINRKIDLKITQDLDETPQDIAGENRHYEIHNFFESMNEAETSSTM